MKQPVTPSKTNSNNDPLTALYAGLETLGNAVLVLDGSWQVVYVTTALSQWLETASQELCTQSWLQFVTNYDLNPTELTIEPQIVTLQQADRVWRTRAWQRPLPGTTARLVSFEDLTAEETREQETRLVFSRLQSQADNLFALYQITQFIGAAQELHQLCRNCLRELERLTEAEKACLYLATEPNNWEPQVWHGLIAPPNQPDIKTAEHWFREVIEQTNILALPLLAEERQVGLVLLSLDKAAYLESGFLNTIAKEMGAALQSMSARQALLAKEQNLEAIVTRTTDAIIQVNLTRQICDFNPGAERLTGQAAAAVLGQPCSQVLQCEQGRGCGGQCLFHQVLEVDQPIPYTELTLNGPAGLAYLAASVTALETTGATAPAAVAILRDISHQKQIEGMKNSFTAMVSHELRTPLALLRGYSDTMQYLKLSDSEQAECITGIATTTARLEKLVEQILDVSRIETGRLILERQWLQFYRVVERAIRLLPQTHAQTRIKTEVAGELPLLYGDPTRLEQLMLNLLENALKYSPPTSLVVVRVQPHGHELLVEVEDHGIGVPVEDIATLFDKFQRASNARQLQLPGTGLGLFICRNIVEAHGGTIRLESENGQGTRVTFWLPLSKEDSRVG